MSNSNGQRMAIMGGAAGSQVAIVSVPAELLLALLTLDGTKLVTLSGIPADAAIAGLTVDPTTQTVWLKLQHESFAEVPAGGMIPVLDVQCKTVPVTAVNQPVRFREFL